MLTTLALALAFALNDRFAGGGSPDLDDKIPGRGFVIVGLLIALACYFLIGHAEAFMALAWVVQRSLPFPDGSQTPDEGDEYAKAFLRHGLTIPAAAVIAYGLGLDVMQAVLAFGGYTGAAVLLAAAYGRKLAEAIETGEPLGQFNTYVELARGAAFGVALSLAF